MRVAIVAESFLPNVNGVTNSVLRVIEHLRHNGHEVLVIAPDTPRGEPPADRVHEGVRVHRVPSRMFPKVTSLPLGVPRPRMVKVLRGFDPDVVHLASPALLGYGGLHAARYLGVPTVAVFQTDVAGFAQSYGIGYRRTGRLGMDPAPAQPCRPHAGAVDCQRWKTLPHIASLGSTSGRAASTSRATHRLRATSSCAGSGHPTVSRSSASSAGSRPRSTSSASRCWAGRDDLQLVIVGDGVDRAKLESTLPTAVFTGALYGEELATAYASMDVFVHPGEHETFCQAVQEAMASGLPVIAPDAGGPRDLVAPMHTGLLLPVAEFEARLTTSVDHLLAERQRYSVAARRSVLGRTWPAICDELHRPLRGCARHPRRQGGVRTSRQPCASTETGCHSSHVLSRLS